MRFRFRSAAVCLMGGLSVVSFGAPALSPVAEAAMNRDLKSVRSLVAAKADVNAPQADGTTALTWAVRSDDVEMVDLLLKAGADAKAANREGATPLYQAAENANPAMIERLLKAGADVDGRLLTTGETPLMEVARTGIVPALKVLVDHGADVNAKENLRATTALMWAASQGHADAVRFLLEHGADVSAESKRDKAKAYGTAGPGARLPKDMEAGGLTPLIFAVRENAMDCVSLLLDSKADVNQTTADGSSPLLVAVLNGRYEMAHYLIDRGANVSLANKKGWTPLYLAVKHRTIETGTMPVPPNADQALDFIKLILNKGAETNTRLAYESEVHSANHVFWLKEEGATAFFRAAYGGDVEVMKLLLEHGADPNLTTKDHTTPLMGLAGVGFTLSLVHHRSHQEDMEALNLLLSLGGDINAANDQGLTALMGAAQRGANEEIKVLVDRGAKLDVRDKGSYCGDSGKSCTGQGGMLALNYAIGVPVTVQMPVYKADTVALLEKLMTERGIPVPSNDR
jgi:ankyrin repeat protein